MILGIDTSNYTTSIALFDGEYSISKRKILPVKEGQRGLRQSDALFHHIKQLPILFESIPKKKIDAVAFSSSPRNVEGSYMPVFLAGESFARSISSVLDVPCYSYSHQEGHIMAGIYSQKAYNLLDETFISVHLSGGTLEILKTVYINNRFECEIIGKTLDISAGQLIDRIGVDLGLKFPCGKELDELSRSAKNPVILPVSVSKADINLSGAETKCKTFYKSYQSGDICFGVLECISKSLEKAINYCIDKYNIKNVLLAGGVASNSVLRELLPENINANVIFSSPELSTDNAVGIAVLGFMKKR